ncbi:hypothetical protein E2C01_091061 [Portunus trituberculatus]|uniref:Secreted protein n=1 Tax=Portunus trituberculatus TaxID=210409 RepID=A0A5B7JN20_PORTR|nr:hypothetical protein [Portunus trituberculatus]
MLTLCLLRAAPRCVRGQRGWCRWRSANNCNRTLAGGYNGVISITKHILRLKRFIVRQDREVWIVVMPQTPLSAFTTRLLTHP